MGSAAHPRQALEAPVTWQLTVAGEPADGLTVLGIGGRLGVASSGGLVEAVVRRIDSGERRLLLDLAGVDYMSSAGLQVLDALCGRMHLVGGRLVLCSLTEPVRMAFELSGLLPHFQVEPSRAAGIAALQTTGPAAG